MIPTRPIRPVTHQRHPRCRPFGSLLALAVTLSAPACQTPRGRATAPADPVPSAATQADRPAPSVPYAVRELVESCRTSYASLRSYSAELVTRERAAHSLSEPEVIEVRFRAEPWSIGLKWTRGPHRGREAVYVRGANRGRFYVMTADFLIPLLCAMRPDNPIALRYRQYPITQAGIGPLLQRLEQAIGDPGPDVFQYAGLGRSAAGRQVHRIVQSSPDGGRVVWSIDEQLRLPVGVGVDAPSGETSATYRYRHVRLNVALTDADFDPAKLWPGRVPLILDGGAASAPDTPASRHVDPNASALPISK